MNNQIKIKTEEEIERLLEELGKVEPSSEDYKELTAIINTLCEMIHKDDVTNNDHDIKVKEMKQNCLWNGVKTGIEITSVIAPLVFYGIWMNKGFKFEEEGILTSSTFKGLISKFKPTR